MDAIGRIAGSKKVREDKASLSPLVVGAWRVQVNWVCNTPVIKHNLEEA